MVAQVVIQVILNMLMILLTPQAAIQAGFNLIVNLNYPLHNIQCNLLVLQHQAVYLHQTDSNTPSPFYCIFIRILSLSYQLLITFLSSFYHFLISLLSPFYQLFIRILSLSYQLLITFLSAFYHFLISFLSAFYQNFITFLSAYYHLVITFLSEF